MKRKRQLEFNLQRKGEVKTIYINLRIINIHTVLKTLRLNDITKGVGIDRRKKRYSDMAARSSNVRRLGSKRD